MYITRFRMGNIFPGNRTTVYFNFSTSINTNILLVLLYKHFVRPNSKTKYLPVQGRACEYLENFNIYFVLPLGSYLVIPINFITFCIVHLD